MIKKVLIGASTLAMISSPAMALPDRVDLDEYFGNYSAVEQTGTNDARVNQERSTWGSASSVVQNGADNYAEVDQVDSHDLGTGNGHSNYSAIEQLGAGNDARVEQTTYNFDGEPDRANVSQIVQEGDALIANVRQDGAANSWVEQSGSDNEADVEQTGYGFGDSHVSQSGAANIALVDQYTTSDYASLNSEVRQIGYANIADIEQIGENAHSEVRQLSYDGPHDAWVRQTSSGEGTLFSNISQLGGASNEADVTQSGDAADSDIYQTGFDQYSNVEQSSDFGGDLESDVDQSGSFNVAEIFQSGAGDIASVVSQSGSDNYANVSQTSAIDATSIILQSGSGNTAYVTQ